MLFLVIKDVQVTKVVYYQGQLNIGRLTVASHFSRSIDWRFESL